MPAVKNVGEPCAGEPHARFEVAAGGNQTSRASTRRAVQAPLADPTKTRVGLEDQGEWRLTEGKWIGRHRFSRLARFGSSAFASGIRAGWYWCRCCE